VTTIQDLAPTRQPAPSTTRLTVLIPALNEGPNLAILLPRLIRTLEELSISHDVIVITKEGDLETIEAASTCGANVLLQTSEGYGGALVDGLRRASSEYVLTLDADLSHRPDFVKDMWLHRDAADIIIASRYVPGGTASMPRSRLYLSRALNLVFRRGLSMPVSDLSSGFRLYRRDTLDPESLQGTDFDVLEEILVRSFCEGWRVQEIPFNYMPREHGSSSARVGRLGVAYIRAFWSLWKLRNSIAAADYDYRAFDSPIPLQRYWQRSRFRIVTALIAGEGPVLDVGCGSSRIIGALPRGSVALDVLKRKLRFDRRFGVPIVHGSGFALPFQDASFRCVLSSEVIEHVPKESPIIDELVRVLKPGGRLVVGTPDYSRWEWVYLEKLYARIAPGGYADEHIAHYTRKELIELMKSKGLVHEETRYIARGELIQAFRRIAAP
jgi:dolichol-phosphate mannosyltransferase